MAHQRVLHCIEAMPIMAHQRVLHYIVAMLPIECGGDFYADINRVEMTTNSILLAEQSGFIHLNL